ncbi:MAG: ABC-2 family transporter protein [Oscillospiraceae bacterium]|nr:ABC-2 family transporter protein [Oscillospiraceae bacterium]
MKKRSIIWYLRIYIKIITQDIKVKLNYRADFVISNFAQILHHISGFIVFWLIFQNFPSVDGWDYYEMLFFYGFSLIAFTPTQCLLENNWSLPWQVRSGDFIKYCFRPINTFFYYISEVFDTKGFGQLVAGIVVLAFAWLRLEIAFSFITLALLILMLSAAGIFMAAMLNLAASTIFWTKGFGLMEFVVRFRDYSRYPITIFSGFLRYLFTFAIPMAFISYYPSLMFLRPDQVPILTWLSPLIGIAFFALSYFAWMKGAKSYSGTGS